MLQAEYRRAARVIVCFEAETQPCWVCACVSAVERSHATLTLITQWLVLGQCRAEGPQGAAERRGGGLHSKVPVSTVGLIFLHLFFFFNFNS